MFSSISDPDLTIKNISRHCQISIEENYPLLLRLPSRSGSDGKASAYNVGDLGSIPGLERSPGEGNSNPLQYSCLENPMDRESWQATVHGVAKSRTRLSDFTFFLS